MPKQDSNTPKQAPTTPRGLLSQDDDQLLLDSMADEDDYYQRMHRRGSYIGAGTDLFGKVLDYQGRISGANLLAGLGEKRKKRAQDLIDTAGAGAEDRIATARGQQMSAARGVLKRAADKAAMNPTGAGVVELTRRSPGMIKDAGDTSEQETREMKAALDQKALGLQHKSAAEDMELQAKHQKQIARLQGVKDIVFGAAELTANLQPQSYEAKKQTQAMKSTRKGFKKGQKGLTAMGKGARSKIAGSKARQANDEKKALRLESKGERQMKRGERKIEKGVKSFGKAEEATEDLQKAYKARLAKQRRLWGPGNTLASSFTPGTTGE